MKKLILHSRFAAALLALALPACAGLDTQLPDINEAALSSETRRQETLGLKEVNAQTARLARVAWPILRDNAELCPKTRAGVGIWSHSLKDYDGRLRDAAARVLDAKETETVFQVPPGSPAHAAGIKPGDVVTAIGAADPARSGDLTAFKSGVPAIVTINRDGTLRSLTMTPVDVCDYGLKLASNAAVNAYADGKHMVINAGMVDFVENDNELALIIGHEMAHNTMGHIRKSIQNIVLSGLATRYTRPFESEADYVGLYYQVRAGYSPEGVEDFWRRLSLQNLKNVARAKTHPTFPDRFVRLAAARNEIEAKQQSGERLVPNFKKDAPPKS